MTGAPGHARQMSDQKITVQRTVDASAKDLFEVLTNPKRHTELDGSGFVRSDERSNRIQGVGDVFTMNMEGDHMGGEYQTDNHVTAYAENTMVGWQTAPAGTDPKGWEWLWELDAQGPDSTLVSLTYDWSKVTDKELLQQVSFPLVSKGQLEDSLGNLAAAVSS
ncbi:hypothetical protein ABIB53_003084 [Janibacter sp. UYMM211]